MSTTPPRRSQAERRAASRKKILDSTAQCLIERGYAATTISEIQQRTGLARGTLQHHFPTRADLLITTVTHVVDTRVDAFQREAAALPEDIDRIDALVELVWRDLNSPAFFAAVELWVAARTDADLRTQLLQEEARVFAEMRRVYAACLGEPLATDPRTPELIEFTIDLLTGLSMTTMLTGSLGDREAVLRRWKLALAVLSGRAPAEQMLEGRSLQWT
ncbi:TetR family transcriptional regulator [Nocardioides baekrokdamisoli]|uniref:TetR family transcriptional regulator n=1 Tax=Nocardioides baekrokdamisoli TaxID=1804624 RepID=A0A3G9J002_9ACTN|nr:TetR/AcrR family transcriptional regulator [Nocardioides baekrokdamisoli]BBH16784.1 TetR family transcriptional regulator [Nocardioides baekrokdamisoli]